jgi:hypothetical protein
VTAAKRNDNYSSEIDRCVNFSVFWYQDIKKTQDSDLINGCRDAYNLIYEVSVIVSSVHEFPILVELASICAGTLCKCISQFLHHVLEF